jgi:tetratricopeptide (TPR) repeat protein
MNRATLVLVVLFSGAFASAQTESQKALDRGAELYREGRFEEAARAFERAAELDPGSLGVWESLGWAYRKAGKPDEAKEVWTRILKVDPARASLWNQVAAIDIEREDWTAAADSLAMSLSLEPGESHVRTRLAMALESAGRVEEAAQAYEELARRDPENLTPVLRLASFYERSGEIERALETLSAASRRSPRFAHIFGIHIARLEARRADQAYAAATSPAPSKATATRSSPIRAIRAIWRTSDGPTARQAISRKRSRSGGRSSAESAMPCSRATRGRGSRERDRDEARRLYLRPGRRRL